MNSENNNPPDYDHDTANYRDYFDNNKTNDNIEQLHRTVGETSAIVLLVIFHVAFLVICGVGNIILIVLTLRLRKLQTSTNLLFLNLVCGDSMAALVWSPIMIDYLLTDGWNVGVFMCKTAEFLKRVSMFVSINSLVVISLDRLRAVLLPLKGTMSRQSANISIVVIWIVSVLFGVPRVPFAKTFCHKNGKCLCMTEWKQGIFITLKQYSLFVLFGVEYILPLSIMSVSYLIIGYKIWKRPLLGTASAERVRASHAHKIRIIRLLIFVVLVFALCWLPYQIYIFNRDVLAKEWIEEFDPYKEMAIYYPIETVALASGVFNTFMCIVINDHLKECLMSWVPCGRRTDRTSSKKILNGAELTTRVLNKNNNSCCPENYKRVANVEVTVENNAGNISNDV